MEYVGLTATRTQLLGMSMERGFVEKNLPGEHLELLSGAVSEGATSRVPIRSRPESATR